MNDISTTEQFEEAARSPEGRLVLFYSAWCPFCTSFLPVYDKAAAAAPARFARLRTDDLEELEDRFGVEVVPTVLFFRNGKLEKRLDGLLGRGLNADQLRDFAAACGRD